MKWTAEADRKLLLLLLDVSNVKYGDVAARWAQVYGKTTDDGEAAPTARALENRLSKLKQMVNGGNPSPANGSAKSKAPSTPRVKKPKTPSTSTNGKKRKKSLLSDDDEEEPSPSDETDPEAEQQMIDVAPRGSLPRAKKVRTTYKDGTSSSEEDGRDADYGTPENGAVAVDSPMEGQESFGMGEKEIKMEVQESNGVENVFDFQP